MPKSMRRWHRRPRARKTDPVKTAVRDLLRVGGYKPAGRGKPASEYLAQAAERGEFPRISHIVDALNLVSLESRLPISLLDADRVMDGTDALVIRFGRPGESYVFNSRRARDQILKGSFSWHVRMVLRSAIR